MRTSNIERPTSNVEVKRTFAGLLLEVRRSMFDVRCSFLSCFIVGLSAPLSPAATTAPTSQAVTQPVASDLQVHEWAVFVIDGATGQLNPEGIVTATLPSFVTDRRYGSAGAPPAEPAALNGNVFVNRRVPRRGVATNLPPTPSVDNDEPSPVGVIRLIGSADSKVDVSLAAKGGTFLGSWPKAQDRANELLWRDLTVADKSDGVLSGGVGPNHWFSALRSASSAFVTAGRSGTDKFLLYDLEMPYASPIKAKELADFSVELSNSGNAPLHNLTLYQGGDHDSWHTLVVGDLAAAVKPTTKPTTSTTKQIATTRPAATTKPALKMVVAPTTQPADLIDDWKPIITSAGVDPIDADVIQRIIGKYAFDPHRLTAVYRMDDAEFDRLLPLEIVPQPAKITRFGLVIIINADPTGGTAIDDWVKQLGDQDWGRRDAAYRILAGMGPAATEKLKAASKSTDLEIAWRAERLLALSGQLVK